VSDWLEFPIPVYNEMREAAAEVLKEMHGNN
jgi:hypothetical protein